MPLLLLPLVLFIGLIAAAVAIPVAIVLIPLALVLWIPFLLVKLAFRLVFAFILLPILLIGGLIGLVFDGLALVAGLLVPLLPLLLIAGAVWLVWRLVSGERLRLPA